MPMIGVLIWVAPHALALVGESSGFFISTRYVVKTVAKAGVAITAPHT
jgi:hypothetical protein